MALGFLHGQMVEDTKVNIRMIRNMALELTRGQMRRNMKASGLMGSSPVLEFITNSKMASRAERENGRVAKEFDGLTKTALFVKFLC